MATEPLIKTTLPNGLRVILQEIHVAPVASFWIFYRVGSRNELPGRTGISHWVEHMLFKGTERFPHGEFDRAVARAGGVFNGMTGHDWTTYFETFPADRIELALQVESDRMANSLFDSDETELERTVIVSEREGSENSYFAILSEEVQAAAYLLHSYHNPIIGWKSDLLTMTRADLLNHYATFYTPNNAVVVAVGHFDADTMLAKIEEYFGAIAAGPELPSLVLQEPEQRAERRVILRGPEPTAYFMQMFHVPAATHPDFFPLTVLDAVLGGAKGMGLFGDSGNNRSNRLYRALVDTELAVAVGSSYRLSVDPDLFGIYVTVAPGIPHQSVEDVIWHEIEKVQQEGVQMAEVVKAIKQIKAQFAYSSESVTNQAYWLGFSEIVTSTEWYENWLDNLTAVTPEDVQRVAHQYFSRSKQTVGWYIPEEIAE
jgi:zinc protease